MSKAITVLSQCLLWHVAGRSLPCRDDVGRKVLIVDQTQDIDIVQLSFIIHYSMFRLSRSVIVKQMSGTQKEI